MIKKIVIIFLLYYAMSK